MEQANNAIELFQGLLSLGGLVTIIWAAGFLVFNVRQVKKDLSDLKETFKEHKRQCNDHDYHSRLSILEERLKDHEREIFNRK